MLHSNVLRFRRRSGGFTLAEVVAVALVLAILVVVAVPSVASAMDRVKLNQAVTDVRGAFQEAQRQAIRSNTPCVVTVDPEHKKVSGTCLMTGNRTLPDKIQLVSNIVPYVPKMEVAFGVYGTAKFTIATNPPITDPSGKVILYLQRSAIQDKKCIVISGTLGLSRLGNYSGPTGSGDITNNGVCTTGT